MDLKIYEKTRYQNIYRHKKNKNYIIQISKPIKTTISKVDGIKIFDIESAKEIRDTYSKNSKVKSRGTVTTFWDKYMYDCEYISNYKSRTLKKKRNIYNKYIKLFYPDKLLLKITEYDVAEYFKKDVFKNISNKQKNNILKELKAFFSWCKCKKHISINPLLEIKKFQADKPKINFWEVNNFIEFKKTVEIDINSNNIKIKQKALLINTLACIGMCIGDRIGETRILKFGNCDRKKGGIWIDNSIDDSNPEFESTTKTYESTRFAQAPSQLFDEIDRYKDFLINELKVKVTDETYIFLNYSTNKPYSDTNLRDHFYYYIEKACVPKITMYALRHSYVANMMSQGYELYHISSNIGHTNYSTTVNYYGGLSNEVKKKIADASSNIFKK